MTKFLLKLVAFCVLALGGTVLLAGQAFAHHPVITGSAARPCGAQSEWTATFTAESDADYNKDWHSKHRIDGGAFTAFSAFVDDQVDYGPFNLGPFPASKASVLVRVDSEWRNKGGNSQPVNAADFRELTINRPAATTCPLTTASVQFRDPTCADKTVAVFGQTNTDKVTYVTTGTVAPGGQATVTATPKTGYSLSPNPTVFQHTFGQVPDCRVVVTPVAPTVTRTEVCGQVDTFTTTPVQGVTYTPASGNLPEGVVTNVTATPNDGYRFDGPQSVVFPLDGSVVEVCETTTVPPTTQPPTTTTEPPVVTTVPPTVPPTTTPPTEPPTTVPPVTEPSTVPPTTVAFIPVAPEVLQVTELPATGLDDSMVIALLALGLIVVGFGAGFIARRKPTN